MTILPGLCQRPDRSGFEFGIAGDDPAPSKYQEENYHA
jgi:hypothetical protein